MKDIVVENNKHKISYLASPLISGTLPLDWIAFALSIIKSDVKSENSVDSYNLVTGTDYEAYELYRYLKSFTKQSTSKSEISSDEKVSNCSFFLFPSTEFLPFEIIEADSQILGLRQKTLYDLLISKSKNTKKILITSVPSLFQKVVSPNIYKSKLIINKVGNKIDKLFIISALEAYGYKRKLEVSNVGEYADHGHVLDIFTPIYDDPRRIEIAQGVLQSIRILSAETQRSKQSGSEESSSEQLSDSITICPIKEFTRVVVRDDKDKEELDKRIAKFRKFANTIDMSSSEIKFIEEAMKQDTFPPGSEYIYSELEHELVGIESYMPDNTFVSWMSAREKKDAITSWSQEIETQFQKLRPGVSLNNISLYKNETEVSYNLDNNFVNYRGSLDRDSLDSAATDNEKIPLIHRAEDFRAVTNYKDSKNYLNKEIVGYLKALLEKYKSVILSIPASVKSQSLIEFFHAENIKYTERFVSILQACEAKTRGLSIVYSESQESFFLSDNSLILLNEKILFGAVSSVKRRKYPFRKASFRSSIGSLKQLNEEDFVVHELYGIGKFLGLTKKNILGHSKNDTEYLEVEYAGGDKLYVPVYDFLKVGKYSGQEGAAPVLTKLGGGQWDIIRAKIKNDIAQVTSSLLKTLAVRSVVEGTSFEPFNSDDQWFAEQFTYEETIDQRKVIEEVLSDMCSSKPMDRLVCGDVGFGKTEVALRAAFKAVNSGKQVALLVPTTILAEQHGKTFLSRFASTHARVEVLNRFVDRKHVKQVISDLAEGKVDILIGTHRIIQSDIIFKDLGLVIVDEEHRFGVAQKEKLKRLRASVDLLSLSATPIPRTLQMALFGTRDLSVIETPPADRLAIKTSVLKFDTNEYARIIQREIDRGGQVYIVHHFISELSRLAEYVTQFVQNARVAIIHGKIPKKELEQIMEDFYDGKINVLVATHIIESGIDVPNANTMVIVDPQLFGLAQLYQLRGRVGRSDIQAHCYLMYKEVSELTTDAKRRLDALSAADELGVGFKLALQDLEIRGAGAFLGKNQSGHVQAVGYDMYLKILEEAVKVEKSKRDSNVSIEQAEEILIFDTDLQVGIYPVIPESFIPDPSERMIYYQKSGYIKDVTDAENLLDEFKDRFGTLPLEIVELVEFMLVRGLASNKGIHRISRQEKSFILSFVNQRYFDNFMLKLKKSSHKNWLALESNKIRINESDNVNINDNNSDGIAVLDYLKSFLM